MQKIIILFVIMLATSYIYGQTTDSIATKDSIKIKEKKPRIKKGQIITVRDSAEIMTKAQNLFNNYVSKFNELQKVRIGKEALYHKKTMYLPLISSIKDMFEYPDSIRSIDSDLQEYTKRHAVTPDQYLHDLWTGMFSVSIYTMNIDSISYGSIYQVGKKKPFTVIFYRTTLTIPDESYTKSIPMNRMARINITQNKSTRNWEVKIESMKFVDFVYPKWQIDTPDVEQNNRLHELNLYKFPITPLKMFIKVQDLSEDYNFEHHLDGHKIDWETNLFKGAILLEVLNKKGKESHAVFRDTIFLNNKDTRNGLDTLRDSYTFPQLPDSINSPQKEFSIRLSSTQNNQIYFNTPFYYITRKLSIKPLENRKFYRLGNKKRKKTWEDVDDGKYIIYQINQSQTPSDSYVTDVQVILENIEGGDTKHIQKFKFFGKKQNDYQKKECKFFLKKNDIIPGTYRLRVENTENSRMYGYSNSFLIESTSQYKKRMLLPGDGAAKGISRLFKKTNYFFSKLSETLRFKARWYRK